MKSFGIRAKMVVGIVLVLALGAVVIALLLQRTYASNLEQAARLAVSSAQDNFSAVQRGETNKLYSLLDVLTTDAAITDAFAARDRELLSETTRPRFDMLKERQGVDRWYFYMPREDGTVFLRAYKGADALTPEEFGDVSERPTYLKAAESGEKVAGFELGSTALALRAASPYMVDGENLGVMAVGVSVGNFLNAVAEQTGDSYGMYLDKQYFDEKAWADAREAAGLEDNWGDHADAVLVSTTVEDEQLLGFEGSVADIPDGGVVLGEIESGDRTFVRGAFPVYEAGDRKVAAVYVMHDITDTIETLRATQLTVLLGVGGLMIVLSIVIIVMLNRLVFVRLDSMIGHIKDVSLRLAGGDYDVEPLATDSTDEIGVFESFLGDFVSLMANTLKSLSGKQ